MGTRRRPGRSGGRLSSAKIGLVFGGGRIGLMGVLAETVLAGGGEAIGVIPKDLMDKGLGLTSVTSLRVVETMHAAQGPHGGAGGCVHRHAGRVSARRRSSSRP